MSSIDTLSNMLVGYLGENIRVYQALDDGTVDGAFVNRYDIVIGGGHGEYPAIIINPESALGYFLYWQAFSIGANRKDYDTFTNEGRERIQDGWLVYAGWQMADFLHFNRYITESVSSPWIDDGGKTTVEKWLHRVVGELVFEYNLPGVKALSPNTIDRLLDGSLPRYGNIVPPKVTSDYQGGCITKGDQFIWGYTLWDWRRDN